MLCFAGVLFSFWFSVVGFSRGAVLAEVFLFLKYELRIEDEGT
jgi:hypothetical protein